MKTTRILLVVSTIFILASCNSEAETENTSRNFPSDSTITTKTKQADSGAKAVDYIPPIGTGQSSAGNVKRERKFHIR